MALFCECACHLKFGTYEDKKVSLKKRRRNLKKNIQFRLLLQRYGYVHTLGERDGSCCFCLWQYISRKGRQTSTPAILAYCIYYLYICPQLPSQTNSHQPRGRKLANFVVCASLRLATVNIMPILVVSQSDFFAIKLYVYLSYPGMLAGYFNFRID